MGRVKSYYSDQLELGREKSPDSMMSVGERENILFNLLVDDVNLLAAEAAELDRSDST